MANTFFAFKQFVIHQEACAMKVCTDSCLFGAWVAWQLSGTTRPIADVGAGTGLLSLMMAQAFPKAVITAVEKDPAAARQCGDNAAASNFAGQIMVVEADVRTWEPIHRPGLLVSNPPFYEHQLASGKSSRDAAHHSTELSLEELFQCFERLAGPDARLALLMPRYRKEETVQLLTRFGWHLTALAEVQQHPGKAPFRGMFTAAKTPAKTIFSEKILIRETGGEYSARFTELLSPYYLHL